MQSNKIGLLVLILIILLCCIGICCVGVAGAALYGISKVDTDSDFSYSYNFGSEDQANGEFVEEQVVPLEEIIEEPVSTSVQQQLDDLNAILISKQDARDIAKRLQGLGDIPEVLAESAEPLSLGAQSDFWVTNTDTNISRQIGATLQYATPHVYFWVDNDVEYDQGDLEKLVDTFENEIYPTNHEFFGTEWMPGVDGDKHIYILYGRDLGSNLAGYFSSNDSINPLAAKYSNAHEMFFMNADTVELWEDYIYGVLAHEFQHMIHWNLDSNEESWMNEGFSELATQLNGYDTGGFDETYLMNTDLQLNDWPVDSGDTSPHYGSSFLFISYFLDRFGEELTKQLVRSEENGFESMDDVFAASQITDAATGELVTADDLFVDWSLANYLQDDSIEDGRYDYRSYDPRIASAPNNFDSECLSNWQASSVKQYGVDMIEYDCSGKLTMQIDGSNIVKIVPMDPYSGKYAFWSNKGDDSDISLTRKFDLSGTSGAVSMSYYTWYDIEVDYDYVYVLTSRDGENWDFVNTAHGTSDNPTGGNLGWGYNGQTEGWIQETIDLSAFAGEDVYVRFEYITDAAVNAEGFLVDDIAVPAINYFEDFENGTGDWQADGFARIMNELPQTFRVTVLNKSGDVNIRKYTLNPNESISVDLDFEADGPVVVFVSGTTRFTRQPANYKIRFTE